MHGTKLREVFYRTLSPLGYSSHQNISQYRMRVRLVLADGTDQSKEEMGSLSKPVT